jgi:hypothetical protein
MFSKTFQYLKNLIFPESRPNGPNYHYVKRTDPKPIPPVNQRNKLANERVVKHALWKYLQPYDYDIIVNTYYMPEYNEELVYHAIQRGDLPDHSVPRDIHYQRARQRALELLSPPWPVRPVHFSDLVHYPWNKKPSAEEPYTTEPVYKQAIELKFEAHEIENRKLSTGNLLDEIFVRTRNEIHTIKRRPQNHDPNDLLFDYIMNIHVKPQLSKVGEDPKFRIIYGVPKLYVMIECMFFWPIINYHKYAQRSDTPFLWPYVTLLGGWYRLNYDLTKLYFNTYTTVDWSGFDFRALFSVIKDCQQDWRSMFDFEHGYIPVNKPPFDYSATRTDPHRLQNLWDYMCKAQLATKHRLPDGTVWIRVHRGIPSGLFLTQWLDSHYNLLMLLTILDRLGIDISNIFIKVQGDDSIAAFRVYIPTNQHEDFRLAFSYYAKFYFDAIARPEKTQTSSTPEGLEVLGYANANGLPTRDWRKLLAQLLYPKARSPTYSTLMARCIGITYADCGMHQQVSLVCKDIFDYLQSLGYTPNASAMQDISAMFDEESMPQMDHFPTLSEVQTHLRSFAQYTAENRAKFWPAIFLADH